MHVFQSFYLKSSERVHVLNGMSITFFKVVGLLSKRRMMFAKVCTINALNSSLEQPTLVALLRAMMVIAQDCRLISVNLGKIPELTQLEIRRNGLAVVCGRLK